MSDKKPYFEIKDDPMGPTLTATLSEAKNILDDMAENDSDEKYTFSVVMLTKGEYDSLPGFDGF